MLLEKQMSQAHILVHTRGGTSSAESGTILRQTLELHESSGDFKDSLAKLLLTYKKGRSNVRNT